MSLLNRRESIKVFLGGLLQTTGGVVLASTVLPARAEAAPTAGGPAKDFAERADRVAGAQDAPPEEARALAAFANARFVNGGFRKAGFANGGFNNGGFRKAGFANGGWRN